MVNETYIMRIRKSLSSRNYQSHFAELRVAHQAQNFRCVLREQQLNRSSDNSPSLYPNLRVCTIYTIHRC